MNACVVYVEQWQFFSPGHDNSLLLRFKKRFGLQPFKFAVPSTLTVYKLCVISSGKLWRVCKQVSDNFLYGMVETFTFFSFSFSSPHHYDCVKCVCSVSDR
ncbi:hypothetical protein M758_4G059800 [Ceratodon purpureus]|nr:hypothetical protein M758_4G059100 [Ceratodon purpureus]KAG0618389.1 hypothetical protein M758_4G059800 [Ceratodon purpureus]